MASSASKSKTAEGESLLFPPKFQNKDEAKQAILLVIRRQPKQFGYRQSRWKLSMIREELTWLNVTNDSSLWHLLQRLDIHYKRGRDYIHSPDRHYMEKLSLIELARLRAYYAPERFVFLYLDEFSYYRQPSVAQTYEGVGKQPLAHRSHASNTCFRVLGTLNALTGQVIYQQRARISRSVLAKFWTQVYQAYPHAEMIYIVVDNWPIHFHPDAMAPLQTQHFPWPPYIPPHWPKESMQRKPQEKLPISLLCLPTYASWLNPIEKLWRWLKQDIIHLHHYSHDWQALKAAISSFLNQFQSGSEQLLHYVGLLPN